MAIKLGKIDPKDLQGRSPYLSEMLRKDESNPCDRELRNSEEDPQALGTLGSESQTATQSQCTAEIRTLY
jgi:hypothetical protein